MLINNSKAEERINSSGNLINRLRELKSGSRKDSMGLFGVGHQFKSPLRFPTSPTSFTPTSQPTTALSVSNKPPTIDDIIDNSADKVKLEEVHKEALDTLHATMGQIKGRLPEVQKVKDLADIASKMGRLVSDLKEQRDKGRESDGSVHYHFYMPEQRKMSDFPVIDGTVV